MKSSNRLFALILSALLLANFLTMIFYYVFSDSANLIENIIVTQLIVLGTLSFFTMIYLLYPYLRTIPGGNADITKMTLLSDTNATMNEFSLENRTSTLICSGETVYFSHHEGKNPSEEYASLNRVENHWYIERTSDNRNVGLKRADEQYVYKLKTGTVYKLQGNDIVYIGDRRLLVI